MFKKFFESANGKLYILLAVTAAVFVFFTASYLKTYYSYYRELYQFRKNLIASLTTEEVKKPEYSLNDPYQGSLNSKIIIFEYGDMSCEACRVIQPAIKQLQDFYGKNKMTLIWKDFPITPLDINIEAHEAIHCANDQGFFADYKDALYTRQGSYSRDVFLSEAKKLGLDSTTFAACLQSRKYREIVENNYREAIRIGLDATPTLFINNTKVSTGFSFEGLRKIVEDTK